MTQWHMRRCAVLGLVVLSMACGRGQGVAPDGGGPMIVADGGLRGGVAASLSDERRGRDGRRCLLRDHAGRDRAPRIGGRRDGRPVRAQAAVEPAGPVAPVLQRERRLASRRYRNFGRELVRRFI